MSDVVVPRSRKRPSARARRRIESTTAPVYPTLDPIGKMTLQRALAWRRAGYAWLA